MEESNKEYSVNWKNHMSHVRQAFDYLFSSNQLIDVTLCCEGRKIGAHKMLLSACSLYFRDIFKEVPCQHPIIILTGVEYPVLKDILHFIYNGEVSVDTSRLDLFLKTAQLLQISGLTDGHSGKQGEAEKETSSLPTAQNSSHTSTETSRTNSTPTNTTKEDTRKSVKRPAQDSPEHKVEKAYRTDEGNMYLSDVKCEPNDLIHFEDPLEDPLESDFLQQNDNTNFAMTSTTTRQFGDDDFKRRIKTEPGCNNHHYVETAQGPAKYSCDICGKTYHVKGSLYKHYSVHEGSTKCTICDKVSSRKGNLRRHMRYVHGIE